jgi:hypothetical protein
LFGVGDQWKSIPHSDSRTRRKSASMASI